MVINHLLAGMILQEVGRKIQLHSWENPKKHNGNGSFVSREELELNMYIFPKSPFNRQHFFQVAKIEVLIYTSCI